MNHPDIIKDPALEILALGLVNIDERLQNLIRRQGFPPRQGTPLQSIFSAAFSPYGVRITHGHVCNYWGSPPDLGMVIFVFRSINIIIH